MIRHLIYAAVFILFIMPCAVAQEIGLQVYSVRNEMKTDVPGTFSKLKGWGIKEIEGGIPSGYNLEQFQKLLKDNDMKIVSTGADFGKLSSNPQEVVSQAKALGAKYVVCYWIPHAGDTFGIKEIQQAVTVFNNAGKILRENGLTLAYHPHGFEFRPYENGTLFDYLVKNTDKKNLSFEMDVFWVKHGGGDCVALLNKYPDRFALMHLKDRKPGTPSNQNGNADVESNVVLGQGDVGIAAIMKAAKKAGVKHYFIEDESSRSVEQIPQSLAYLKSLK